MGEAMKEIDFLSGLDATITKADINEILRTGDAFANAIFNPAKVSPQQKIERCRKAVQKHQAFQFIDEEDGCLVWMDAQTAKLIVQAYGYLSEDRKKKYIALPMRDMGRIAWECV